MTVSGFLDAHAANMQQHVPFVELPFYQWMGRQEDPPESFVWALRDYYAGHLIAGCFDDKEITNYRHIYNEFWRRKHA